MIKRKHGGARPNAAAPLGNRNAAKSGVAKLLTVRARSQYALERITELSPEQRGAILTEYVIGDDVANELTNGGQNDPLESAD